jgi:hypothetical protein
MKYFLITLSIIFYANLNSQQPPCYEDYYGLTYDFNKLTTIPPLTSGDTLGYNTLDSIAKNVRLDYVKYFLSKQTYNDTIKKIMKFYYTIVDENPIGFQVYLDTREYPIGAMIPYNINLNDFQREVLLKIMEVSPSPDLDQLILGSQIIAHVKVKNQTQRNDPTASYAKTVVIDDCEIIELFKGFPQKNCIDISIQSPQNAMSNGIEKLLESNYTCLQYEYRKEWRRGKDYDDDNIGIMVDENGNELNNPTMKDNEGNPWTKEGEEYIVCLNYVIICSEGNNLFYSLGPGVAKSWTGTVYPIINGIVVYPPDEFQSIGNNLPLNTFKNIIKNRITQIKSF